MPRSSRPLLTALSCFFVLLAASADPAHAQCGTRWVRVNGDTNPSNNCLSSANACRSINQAIGFACANDTVSVGEGSYFENVLVDRRVFVDSTGVNGNTFLRGTGTGDIVTLAATGAQLNGFTVNGPATGACVRIGDAAHPGVRSIQITNSTMSGCRNGVLVDAAVGGTGDWIRMNGNAIDNAVADAGPDSGVGILLQGGTGRIDIRQNNIRNNESSAIRQLAGANQKVEVGANTITGNGRGALANSRIALEFRQARELYIEGNLVSNSTGLAAVDDGRALFIDGVTVGQVTCNSFVGNDGGMIVSGPVAGTVFKPIGLEVLQNRFETTSGTALRLLAGAAGTTSIYNENLFTGFGVAVANDSGVAADLRHNWWGGPTLPSGAVTGSADTSNLIARAAIPNLARAPKLSGWSRGGGAACYDTLAPAITATPNDGLILIGQGELQSRATIDRPMTLEGIPGSIQYAWCPGCLPAVLDGRQYNDPRRPALTIKNTSNVKLKYLTIHGSGLGTPACYGNHQDGEIGLDLQNVKNSTFEDLIVREAGTTDIRIFGDSDDNTFTRIYNDGMLVEGDTEDLCGHRSRESFLVDGGPRVCEGGSGFTADRNRIFDTQTYHGTRSVKLRYANDTEIAGSKLHGVPSDEWVERNAVNVWIEASNNTWIHDNPEIGNRGVNESIHIEGGRTCETLNSAGTRIERSTISMVENGGIGIYLVQGPLNNGSPLDTTVTCSTIQGAFSGIDTQLVDGTQITLTDIVSDTYGVRNYDSAPLTVSRSWWGSPSGPSGAGPGTGTSVSANVLYPGFLASSSRNDADGDGFTECTGDLDDTNPLLRPVDSCDGVDNDQDGSLDEDFVAQATSCGLGPCASTGTTSCTGGAVGNSCQPGTPLAPNDVTCDLVDDDCDGSTDEEYNGGSTTCGTGGCARSGYIACVNGAAQDSCQPGTPLADDGLCNAIDDDCDGPVDEEFTPQSTACGVGACASTGATSCDAGSVSDSCTPLPPAAPTDALCNGLDDDCDGATDEEYQPVTQTCGLGVCTRTTTTTCAGGVEQGSCTPYPPAAPTDAMCNGLDDDCDGTTDEDFEPQPTVCGVGACAQLGQIICVNGQGTIDCTPGLPQTEICNYDDDDCDGTVDNVAIPLAPDFTALTRSGQNVVLDWNDRGSAVTYDLVRGSVDVLLSSGGDFSAALLACVANDTGAPTWNEKTEGPTPGSAWFFLVRAQNCGGRSTYDDGGPGLAAPRDAEIAASPNACAP